MRTPKGYSLVSHGDMIVDPSRSLGYLPALSRAVHPGSKVLDLGAGTGYFAMVACQLGAECAYAIEPGKIIEIASQFAKANNLADRIVFVKDISTQVTLPEPVDIIVSDLRGVLPLYEQHIPSIVDARRRHLQPGGLMIPQQDTIWAALLEDPTLYQPYARPWLDDIGLDLSAGHKFVVNSWCKANAKSEQLLVRAKKWATLDYRTIYHPNISGELTWTAEREGTAHGMLVWFDAELSNDIGYSNAPGQPELIYGQAFFPFEKPVGIIPGDHIEIALNANFVNGDYVWQWDTQVVSAAKGNIKANFRQSTFYVEPISSAALKRRKADFVPDLTLEAEINLFCLSLVNGARSLEEISKHLAERFPQSFSGWQNALPYVADCLERYAENNSFYKG